ncbi:MAG: M20/M25/M40 family metallo-hydrolase [Acidobacteria bacterium]|nr:M20/M25/M40 family metallo-hydrolase [Acidobacteriota bacterium]
MRGRSAHAGIAPEKGIDAIRVLACIVASLELGRYDAETTANIGVIRGGSSVNTVPEHAVAEGEVRSMRRETVGELLDHFVRVAVREAEVASALVSVRAAWDFEPFALPIDHLVCQRAEYALRRIGLDPRPTASAGGSDANSFNARGLPAVNFGVGAQNPHANDEFVLIEDLEKGADLALALVTPP